MKSNAPWSVKGIERDARETAKEAAKREGMTVGEWLNQMIYSAGDATPSDGEIEGLKLRDLVTAIEHLHKRVADADTKNAGAIDDLTRSFGGAVERVQRLERVKPAEGTHDDLAARLSKLEQAGGDRQRVDALKALEKAVAQVAVQFNNAHKTSIERLDSTERQLQELAERIDHVGGDGEDSSGVTFLKDAVDGLSARIARAERIAGEAAKLKTAADAAADPDFVERTGNRLRVLGDEIKRGGDQINSLEAVIGKLSEQIEAAERRSSEGVQKVSETIAELREQLSTDSDRDANRADIEAAIAMARQETDERIETLQNSFDDMIDRLESLTPATQQDAPPIDDEHIGSDDPVTPLSFDIADDDAETAPSGTSAAPEAADDIEEEIEDPFAFADDALGDDEDSKNETEAKKSDQDDDFSFELDEDDAGANDAQALLSEVQEVFGKKQTSVSDEETEPAKDPTGKSDDIEDEIESLLADLDDAPDGDDEEPAPAAKPLFGGEQPNLTKEIVDDAEEEETADEQKEDYMKAARRQVKEAAMRNAESAKPKRRNLTAKQKAILAARARQKQKATEQAKAKNAEPVSQNTDETAAQVSDNTVDEEKNAPANKLTSIFSALSGHFSRDKTEDDNAEAKSEAIASAENAPSETTNETEEPKSGDNVAFAKLKTAATARPVTVALIGAIALALAALFFLIKDVVFKPETSTPRSAATTTQSAPPAPQTTSVETAAEAPPTVPEAPAIDPQTLYAESVAAMNAAETDEAASAAIAQLQEAAALGHPPAQLQLGELYKTGQGVEQDLGQARIWFRRSANGGNVLAMHRIGVMTARGDGGAADTNEAIGWFELAANRGLVDSQYNLGAIYHPSDDGSASTIQDAGKAFYWYSLAAKNGDQQAAPLAAGVAAALTPTERQEIEGAIETWAAEPSDSIANELAPGQ